MGGIRDGGAVETERIGQAGHNHQIEHHLLGFKSVVHPDGNDARLIVNTTAGQIILSVSLSRMAALDTEVRSASVMMQYRQSMKKYAGTAAFEDLFRTALRPLNTSVIVDRRNADRLFVMQFPDRLPIVIRRSPEEVATALQKLAAVANRSAH